MGFWEKIQKDIRDGLEIVREGGAVFSQRVEELTVEGKKKYQALSLNMKVQDEFTKLGGKIYDLSFKKRNPLTDKRVSSIIARIQKLEERLSALEEKKKKKARKTASRKRPAGKVKGKRVPLQKKKVSRKGTRASR